MLFSSISRWFFLAIVVHHFGAISTSGQHRQPFDRFNKVLFGDEWHFNRVCSNEYSDEHLVSSDHQISSLYEGSFLQVIDKSSEWPLAQSRLQTANQIGLQSRRKLGVTCSAEAWGFADRIEEKLANEPSRDDSICRKQIEGLYSFVETMAAYAEPCQTSSDCSRTSSDTPNFSLKLWNQLNSFGRLSSGLIYQQNLLLGDFDSCAKLDSTRYCVGAYGQEVADFQYTNERNSHLIGLCLPRACSSDYLASSQDLMGKLNSLVRANMPGIVQPSIRSVRTQHRNQLNDIFCPPAQDSIYMKLFKDKLSMALAAVAIIWLCLLVYATLSRRRLASSSECNPETTHETVLNWFNVKTNVSEFLSSRHVDERLVGLNAIKVLAMMWLMATHLSMLIYPYVKNLDELQSYYMGTVHGPIILQGQHCVAIFFIISGILFGMKHLETRKIDIRRVIVWRYFRLMPMYFVAYVYIRKFAHLLGDGPLWDSGVSRQSEVRQCLVESWWVPLLMLSNFKSPFAHCLITGWHIANDFQIYLVLPLLLLARRRLKRATFVLLISGAFITTHLSHMWFWGRADNYDLRQLMIDPVRFGPHYILTRLAFDYVNPLGRLGTYFIGVQLADLLLERLREHKQQQRQLQQHRQQVSQQGRKRVAIEEETSAVGSVGQQAEERSFVGKHSGRAIRETARSAAAATTSVGSLIDSSSQLGQSDQRAPEPALDLAVGGQSKRQAALLTNRNNADSDECRQQAQIKIAGRRPSSSPSSPSLSSPSACTQPDQNRPPLTNFKDRCLLAVGVAFLAVGPFSALIPPDGPLTDLIGSYSKTVGYPGCRLLVELGWSILLYYFLLTNSRLGQASTSSSQSSLRGTKTGTEGRRELLVMDGLKKPTSNKLALGNEWASRNCQSNRHEPIIVAALKWRAWNVLVKANYAVMLTHYALFRLVIQSRRELFLFTWFNFFQTLTFLLLLSYLLGAFVYITVERPLTGLVRHLVSRFIFP